MDIPTKYEFKLDAGRKIVMRIPEGTLHNELLALIDSFSMLAAKAKAAGEAPNTELSKHVLESAEYWLPKLAEGFEDADASKCHRMAVFIGVNALNRMYRRCAGVHMGRADLL